MRLANRTAVSLATETRLMPNDLTQADIMYNSLIGISWCKYAN